MAVEVGVDNGDDTGMVLCIISFICRVDRLCGSHKGKFIFSGVRVKNL